MALSVTAAQAESFELARIVASQQDLARAGV
jgi:hypothetical protein